MGIMYVLTDMGCHMHVVLLHALSLDILTIAGDTTHEHAL